MRKKSVVALILMTMVVTTGISYYFFRIKPNQNSATKSIKEPVNKSKEKSFNIKNFFSKWNKTEVFKKFKQVKQTAAKTHMQQNLAHKKQIKQQLNNIGKNTNLKETPAD